MSPGVVCEIWDTMSWWQWVISQHVDTRGEKINCYVKKLKSQMIEGFIFMHLDKCQPRYCSWCCLSFAGQAGSLPLEAIWWIKWVSGEEYYQILYCTISVAQMVMKLLFWVLEGSYCSIALWWFLCWPTDMLWLHSQIYYEQHGRNLYHTIHHCTD